MVKKWGNSKRRYGLTKKQKKILGEFEVTESYINSVSDKINQRS